MKEIKDFADFTGQDGYVIVDGLTTATAGGKMLLSDIAGGGGSSNPYTLEVLSAYNPLQGTPPSLEKLNINNNTYTSASVTLPSACSRMNIFLPNNTDFPHAVVDIDLAIPSTGYYAWLQPNDIGVYYLKDNGTENPEPVEIYQLYPAYPTETYAQFTGRVIPVTNDSFGGQVPTKIIVNILGSTFTVGTTRIPYYLKDDN